MAVDRAALVQELETHGTVVFCDDHMGLYYLIVMENWDSDIATFDAIADPYVLPDYPDQDVITLVDGVIKTQYNAATT
jgi:hypothetical protein